MRNKREATRGKNACYGLLLVYASMALPVLVLNMGFDGKLITGDPMAEIVFQTSTCLASIGFFLRGASMVWRSITGRNCIPSPPQTAAKGEEGC